MRKPRFPALFSMLACCLFFAGCAKESPKITSVDDLKDKRIGVLQGSVHDLYATRSFPKATVLQYKNPTDIIVAVKSGKVDAGIYTSDELVECIRQQPEITLFGPPLFSGELGLGFHKGDDELRNSFNRFLQEIRRNGVYDDMVERWMKRGETAMPEVPVPKEGKPLLVGLISDNGLPFTVVQGNRLVGFNIELLERFGAATGRKVSYLDMQFGSLIPALASRKIDMIGAVIWMTGERKKQIDFSDPYYVQGANFFVLRKNLAPGAK